MFGKYELSREVGSITIRGFTPTEVVLGFIVTDDLEYIQRSEELPPVDGYQFVQHNIDEFIGIFWEKYQSFDTVDHEHMGTTYKSVDITLLDMLAAKPRLSRPAP